MTVSVLVRMGDRPHFLAAYARGGLHELPRADWHEGRVWPWHEGLTLPYHFIPVDRELELVYHLEDAL